MQQKIYVYLSGLSDPVCRGSYYRDLIPAYEKLGISLEISPMLNEEMSAAQKASLFNQALRSRRYEWIFDVSGGDLANLTLPYLDYEAYRQSQTWVAGFSDLTCVLNALSEVSGKKTLLFPLNYQTGKERIPALIRTGKVHPEIIGLDGSRFPRHARLFGGNLRCFLKLAGTGLMPDLSGSFLVLESMSGGKNRMESMLGQLSQIGVLEEARGFVLGRFSQLERELGSREACLKWLEQTIRQLGYEGCGYYRCDSLGHVENGDGVWISAGSSDRWIEQETIEISQQETVE